MENKMRRKVRSIAEKVKIIDFYEKTKCKKTVCKKFNLRPTSLRAILGVQDKIRKAISGDREYWKTLRNGNYSEIEEILFSWFCDQGPAKLSISEGMMRKKAEEIAKQLNMTQFKATTGFIYRFKRRYNLRKIAGLGDSTLINLQIEPDNDLDDLSSDLLEYNETSKDSSSANTIPEFDVDNINDDETISVIIKDKKDEVQPAYPSQEEVMNAIRVLNAYVSKLDEITNKAHSVLTHHLLRHQQQT